MAGILEAQSASRGQELLEAARALGPTILAAAEEIERERRLPEHLVDALYQAGLFSMLVPASFGGAELDLPSYVRVIEELARADGSVAWCVGQASGLSTDAAYVRRDVAQEVWGCGRRAILANGPGEGNRPGKAIATDDGWRITGRWNFASGSRHATWLLAMCNLFDREGRPLDQEGHETAHLMLVPKASVEMLDVWHVSGLRGTGSFSFRAEDLFVPSSHCFRVAEETRTESGPLYQFTSSGIFGPSFGSVGLGLAHSALTSFVEFAATKTPRGAPSPISQSATVQSTVARSRAKLLAARGLLHAALAEAWAAAVEHGQVELELRVAVRLAATHATHQAREVVDAAYELAGSNAIFANQPFERRFRDIHAVSQQLQARAAHYENVGKFLLGGAPDLAFV